MATSDHTRMRTHTQTQTRACKPQGFLLFSLLCYYLLLKHWLTCLKPHNYENIKITGGDYILLNRTQIWPSFIWEIVRRMAIIQRQSVKMKLSTGTRAMPDTHSCPSTKSVTYPLLLSIPRQKKTRYRILFFLINFFKASRCSSRGRLTQHYLPLLILPLTLVLLNLSSYGGDIFPSALLLISTIYQPSLPASDVGWLLVGWLVGLGFFMVYQPFEGYLMPHQFLYK